MYVTPWRSTICNNSPAFRWNVFNEFASVPIGSTSSPQAREVADSFWLRIQAASPFKPRLRDSKRVAWHCIVQAALEAGWMGGCIRYGRSRGRTNQITQQIIDCAIEANLLLSVPSRPGGTHFSRLLVSEELMRHVPPDPWDFAVQPKREPLVVMRCRETRKQLRFDLRHPIAADTARKLRAINAANARCHITFQRFDPLAQDFVATRRLRPETYRLFHENWWHGRLYTHGQGGHTNLRKVERQTIRFDGEPCIELDYSATHPRMIYHLRGQTSPDDPYRLWGAETTPALRKLAKLVVNVRINAHDHALAACTSAIRLMRDGKLKTGKDRETAFELQAALTDCGYPLWEIFETVQRFHAPIADCFGSGIGAELMRLDSEIALDVLCNLTRQGIPVLGVHDSFIVPKNSEELLREAMLDCYRRRLGVDPIVK